MRLERNIAGSCHCEVHYGFSDDLGVIIQKVNSKEQIWGQHSVPARTADGWLN